MLISGEYRVLNAELHKGAGWGKGGVKFAQPILKFGIDNGPFETVLDYGCGKGALVEELRRFNWEVDGYDPCHPDWLAEPTAADLLVSTDMLEHVEPDCLHEVLTHMCTLADKAAYLAVSTVPAVKHLPDGRNAHLIVEDAEWWHRTLQPYFPFVCLVERRPTTVVFQWLRESFPALNSH